MRAAISSILASLCVVFSYFVKGFIVLCCNYSLSFFCSVGFAVLTGSAMSNSGVLDVKDHCNKTVEIYEDISSPELTNANRNRPLLCTYRFRSFRGAPRDWVLRIRFKKFKVGNILNATHCDGGYLQVCVHLNSFNLFIRSFIRSFDGIWEEECVYLKKEKKKKGENSRKCTTKKSTQFNKSKCKLKT